MKGLGDEIIGRGDMHGFILRKINGKPTAYVYSATNGMSVHYEVFKHKENTRFECVSYPSSKCFGVWAWCYTNYQDAINKYNKL